MNESTRNEYKIVMNLKATAKKMGSHCSEMKKVNELQRNCNIKGEDGGNGVPIVLVDGGEVERFCSCFEIVAIERIRVLEMVLLPA